MKNAAHDTAFFGSREPPVTPAVSAACRLCPVRTFPHTSQY
jgi:hypothetical protein